MNSHLVFPVVSKSWFWSMTALLYLADFLVRFDLFHSVNGFFLYMGTLTVSVLIGLEAVLQTSFEISYRFSQRNCGRLK